MIRLASAEEGREGSRPHALASFTKEGEHRSPNETTGTGDCIEGPKCTENNTSRDLEP